MQNLAALRSVILNRFILITLFVSLFTFHFSLFTPTVQAQSPPDPKPCQDPIWKPEVITDNWLVDENRNPPANLQGDAGAVGPSGASVTVTKEFYLTVDFSKLGAIFGPTNSNYLEGKFQNQEHKTVDVVGLDPTSFSTYHGPEEKAAPRAMLDQLRVKTVNYILENNELGESGDIFTDVNGDNPKKIYDMKVAFGIPDPDNQRGTDAWDNGWGKYWAKIPTAYSEFYEARIVFREESNNRWIQKVLNKEYCPDWLLRQIKFVMPEFFRTTATSGQLNQIIVPSAAQSDHSNDLILQNDSNSTSQSKNILGKFINACLKVFKNNPLSNSLKKVISFPGKLFNPIKTAYAQDNRSDPPDQNDCIRILAAGKEGQDPYCALPRDQIQPGDQCTNQNDDLKLNPDNPNVVVVCTFKIVWQKTMVLSAGDGENQFDSCTPIPFTNLVACSVKVFVWPVFQIPWLAEIWNNTLYSDTEENEPGIGSKEGQEEGRPGVYSFFTPKVIFEDKLKRLLSSCDPNVADPLNDPACLELINLANRLTSCHPEEDLNSSACRELDNLGILLGEYDSFRNCVEQLGGGLQNWDRQIIGCAYTYIKTLSELKKRPGETDRSSDEDAKRRFIGGTDCSKEYVRDNALKPIALQQALGITNQCNLTAAHLPDRGIRPPPPGPGEPPNHDNCNGHYDLNNPLGNFGDPNCTLLSSRSLALAQIGFRVQDPNIVRNWAAIIELESAFNANAYNGASTAGQAFGLFQMGHAAYPQYGLDYQIADPQTEFDRGDVEWPIQISNALNYNNQIGGSFCYWEAAIRLGIAQGC